MEHKENIEDDKPKSEVKRGKNKANIILKEGMIAFCEGNMETFNKAFKDLKDKDKCDVYLKALGYCLPSIKAVDFTDKTDGIENSLKKRISSLINADETNNTK